jgi:eukaryotic-like serine/threonine-protein kinase
MGAQLATEAAGSVLGGRYRVEGSLGRGGMGVVYRARDLATGGVVAVKVLDPRREDGPSSLDQRFVREIAAIQSLKSHHAVRLLDAGTLGDGRQFMAMEHLEGTDLHHLLDGLGRLPVQRAVRLIRQACAALAEAHGLGIVHRDLKPANLFVTWQPDGSEHLKVLDFGISKLPQASMDELALTVTGAVLGSPVYMSPEQMNCSRDVDGRTDIWALGVVLYQCLSGGFPYQADAMPQLCARVLTEDPVPLSAQAAVPPGLEAVVMRCLARDPEHRFARIEDLAAALLPFSGEAGAPAATIVIRPQRFAMPSPPPTPRHTPLPSRFLEPEPDLPADTGHGARLLIYLAGAAVGLIAGIIYMLAG